VNGISFPLGGELAFVPSAAMPLGKVIGLPEVPRTLFAHPATILGIQTELTFGLTYAHRTTMKGIVKVALRMGRRLPTFDALRARVRHLDLGGAT